MYPVIPSEMIHEAMQLAVYFVAAAGAVMSFMFTARA